MSFSLRAHVFLAREFLNNLLVFTANEVMEKIILFLLMVHERKF